MSYNIHIELIAHLIAILYLTFLKLQLCWHALDICRNQFMQSKLHLKNYNH